MVWCENDQRSICGVLQESNSCGQWRSWWRTLTYATFKPCCMKLKNVLEDTYLSNPDYDKKEDIIIDVEDVEEYEEIDSDGE